MGQVKESTKPSAVPLDRKQSRTFLAVACEFVKYPALRVGGVSGGWWGVRGSVAPGFVGGERPGVVAGWFLALHAGSGRLIWVR